MTQTIKEQKRFSNVKTACNTNRKKTKLIRFPKKMIYFRFTINDVKHLLEITISLMLPDLLELT